MANRTQTGILLLVLTAGLAGCEGARGTGPTGPSPVQQPVPQPTSVALRLFTDTATGFSTSNVRDAHDQIVQFKTTGELIFTADGTHLPGYAVIGLTIPAEKVCNCWLEVRFGTKDGERRAYLTADYGHDNPGSLVGLAVAGGVLIVSRTNVFPPGTYTLSGVVTELRAAGQAPLEGVEVYRLYGSGWQVGTTDRNGFYQIQGLYGGSREVNAFKEGYETAKSIVSIEGDTRFDVQLVRR